MPAHKEIEPLSHKEIAIILYFISRGAPYAVASEVIKLRCGTERDIQTCGDGTSFIREQLQKQRVQKSYEHTVVDFYLSNLEIEWTELRALLTLDADVQAIMAKYGVNYRFDNNTDVEHWKLNVPYYTGPGS